MLFFFPENPFSKRGGNVTRAYQTLKILKNLGLEIDLVACTELIEGMGDDFEVDKNIIKDFYPIRRRPEKNLLNLNFWKFKFIKFFSKKDKYNIFITNYLHKNFNKILKKNTYDYIFINYEFWTPLIRNKNLKNAKKIVETHDFITLNEFYRNPKLNVGEKFSSELKNLSFYDKVVAISNEEALFFKKFLGEEKVNFIPQSFPDNTLENTIPFSKKKYDLFFIGSDNPFNIKSANWFLEHVYPKLVQDLKICFVGRICKHIPKKENITLIPKIDDLEEVYQNSKIAICPMIEGTGMKVKVVEALSYGVPVVGTKRAVDGFTEKNDNGCLISDNPEVFKNSISFLLNETNYNKIKNSAIKYFRENFAQQILTEKWKETLNL